MEKREWICRLKNREPEALTEVIEEYEQYVGKIVRLILGGYINELDCRAVVNQVFFLLWENAEKLKEDKCRDLKGYLGAIARNTALNEKKKIARNLPLEEHILGEVNENFSQIELREMLSKAMKQLDKREQILLLKFYFQGKEIRRIAEEEQLLETTVKTKLKRSREKLRKILEKEGFIYED